MLPSLINWLAQTPAPPLTENEIIELLKESNQSLSDSFSQFITAMQFVVVILGVLGAVIAYIFGKNLSDARQVAQQAVTQEVNRRIRDIVDDEVARVQRLLDPERTVSATNVDYIAPHCTGEEPEEVRALRVRGFQSVNFKRDIPSYKLTGQVTVLDLVNTPVLNVPNSQNLSEKELNNQQNALVEAQINQISRQINHQAILIVYVRGRFQAIYQLFEQRQYSASANIPVSLISTVVDSAYLASSLRQT